VLGNDTDPDSDPLTITAATVPAEQGTVEIVNNELVFTPAENFNGDATTAYAISDANGGPESAVAPATLPPGNATPVAGGALANLYDYTPARLALADSGSSGAASPATWSSAT